MIAGGFDNRPFNLRQLFFILFLIAAVFCIYSNAFHTAFVFDDYFFIVEDKAVHISDLSWESLKKAALEGKPADRYLPNISFALNYYYGGLDTFGYHVVNLCVHLITGILLFLFLRITLALYPDPNRALSSDAIAFLAALLWVVHPVGTQSVTYICQRMASMVAMFYLLSLILYIKGRIAMIQAPGNRTAAILYFAGCLLAGLCALATKENAGTLPIVILLFEWFFFQNLKLKFSRGQMILAGFGILAFCAAVFWYMGENPFNRILNSYKYRDFTLTERVMTQWRIVIYYISLFFYSPPSRLNLDHDYPLSVSPLDPATTLICLAAIIGLFAITVLSANKHRLLAFSILWFFITQATESTIIGIELIFEHRTYIPFMMISLMAVLIINHLITNKTAVWAFLSAVTLVFFIWTYQRNHTWRDPLTFWKDCASKSSGKYRPYLNIGLLLYETGIHSEAMDYFKKALTLNPSCAGCCINIGIILEHQGKIDEAIVYYENALRMAPNSADAHLNLGNALSHKNMIEEGNAHYRKALEYDPLLINAHMNLGKNLVKKNQFEGAIKQFNRALELDPNSASTLINIGNAHAQKGDIDKGLEYFKKALALDPNYSDIYNNIANIMVRKGILDQALYYYAKSIKTAKTSDVDTNALKNRNAVLASLQPGERASALFKAAVRFASEKDHEQAIDLFKKILNITPDQPIIYYNIACLYAVQNKKDMAIDWLRQAVNHGYNNWNQLKSDPDMKNIQNEPYVRELTGM